MRPLFPYLGTKSMIANRITAHLPAHHHYVEVCAGSLAVLLAKPPSPAETVNDLDGDLVTFWRVLRDRPDDLTRACELTPHARHEYYTALHSDPGGSDLERARAVWVRLTQGTNRSLHTPTSPMWAKRITTGSHPATLQHRTGRMPAVAARLQHVSLDQRPAVEMVRMYNHPAVCLYVDPPYPGRGDRYPVNMTDDDHTELVDALLASRSSVVVSGYPGTVYDRLDVTAGWQRVEYPSKARVGVAQSVSRTEVLWIKEAAAC